MINENPEAVQLIVDQIRCSQSIYMKQSITGGPDNSIIGSNTINQKKTLVGSAENSIVRLFEKGQGINLTLFNPNVLKEGENEQPDLGKINQHLASNGMNNSASSFGDFGQAQGRSNKGKSVSSGAHQSKKTSSTNN